MKNSSKDKLFSNDPKALKGIMREEKILLIVLRYVRFSWLVLVVSLICFSFCCLLLPVLLVS